jgi:hypothetical protein
MLAQFTRRDLSVQFFSPGDTSILFLFSTGSIFDESTSNRSTNLLKRSRDGQYAPCCLRYLSYSLVLHIGRLLTTRQMTMRILTIRIHLQSTMTLSTGLESNMRSGFSIQSKRRAGLPQTTVLAGNQVRQQIMTKIWKRMEISSPWTTQQWRTLPMLQISRTLRSGNFSFPS